MKAGELFTDEGMDAQFIKDHFTGQAWTRNYLFIKDIWGRDLDTLSDKQREWAKSIADDCLEFKITKLKPWIKKA